MNRKILIGILILAFLAQLAVPVYSILSEELLLKNGKEYKFRTALADPYDPFKGRYVYLSFVDDTVEKEKDLVANRIQNMYAIITEDENGFAKISKLSKDVPNTKEYIKVEVFPEYYANMENRIKVKFPFDRYYMDEELAPEAEKLMREKVIDKVDVYATVFVKSGKSVLDKLYINGKTIEQEAKEVVRQKKLKVQSGQI